MKSFVVYCLSCKDPNITDFYIGKSRDFTRRRRDHFKNCMNTGYTQQQKLYSFMRENGGAKNWEFCILQYAYSQDEMDILEEYCIAVTRPTLNRSNYTYIESIPQYIIERYPNLLNLLCSSKVIQV